MLASFKDAMEKGLTKVGEVVGAMSGRPIRTVAPAVQVAPVYDIRLSLGSSEEPAAGVYLPITGTIEGHILLVFGLDAAAEIAAMMLGEDPPPPGTMELSALARSALSELGNVAGSCLLNAMADATSLAITPQAPVLVVDMAGAILYTVLAAASQTADRAVVVRTGFSDGTGSVQGDFLVLPDPAGFEKLQAAFAGGCAGVRG